MCLNSNLQTGITVCKIDSHHAMWGFPRFGWAERTVNGDCHAFGESVAICPDERRNSAQMVDFAVVFGDAFVWNGLDDFEIELVFFRYRSNGGRARIRLRTYLVTDPRFA